MTTDGGPTLVEAVKSGSVSFRMSAASIAVALRKAVGGALAEGCPGQGAHLQLHQSLGGEAKHVAQNICVGGLFDEGVLHHVRRHDLRNLHIFHDDLSFAFGTAFNSGDLSGQSYFCLFT